MKSTTKTKANHDPLPSEVFEVAPPPPKILGPKTLFMGTAATSNSDAHTALTERESRSYQWSREVFHDFVDQVRAAELDSPMHVDELRNYIMKQLVAKTGDPDGRIALKALEMLGKVKNVDIFETGKQGTVQDVSKDELLARAKKIMGK